MRGCVYSGTRRVPRCLQYIPRTGGFNSSKRTFLTGKDVFSSSACFQPIYCKTAFHLVREIDWLAMLTFQNVFYHIESCPSLLPQDLCHQHISENDGKRYVQWFINVKLGSHHASYICCVFSHLLDSVV